MQKETLINVQSLSKTYKLYQSRRDRIKEFLDPFRRSYHHKHHALCGISFDVKKGEVLGIIGENGSGKSTLLKILASVVSPTSGSFMVKGRVTALLELGAGFSQDLSGIENVFYLGAIQGYSKKEMESRLPAILDFADIGEYAQQAVSSYSSGMYVRLAFSLSINIDPDILITDEALAVGDLRFQQKCFRKIREFKEEGKTILICTHNMSAVKDFCDRAIWLHKGEIREQGDPSFVADCYNAFMTSQEVILAQEVRDPGQMEEEFLFRPEILPGIYQKLRWFDISKYESYGTRSVSMLYACMVNGATQDNVRSLQGGEEVQVLLYIAAKKEVSHPVIEMSMNGPYGASVWKISSSAFPCDIDFEKDKPKVISLRFQFPQLGNGRYTLSFGMFTLNNGETTVLHMVHDALIVDVFNPDIKYRQGTQLVITHAELEVIV